MAVHSVHIFIYPTVDCRQEDKKCFCCFAVFTSRILDNKRCANKLKNLQDNEVNEETAKCKIF